MEQPLQITSHKLSLSQDVEAVIRREVAKLAQFYPRIISCRVLLDAEHRFPAGEVVAYGVRIDLAVPNAGLLTTRQTHEDLLTAIQRAFDASRRQLEDHARIQRGDVGVSDVSPHGRVRQLFPWEGYGFLKTPDGREVYFHRNSVQDGAFDRLEVGSEVRFVEEPGEKGPQATTVAPVFRGRRRRSHQPKG